MFVKEMKNNWKRGVKMKLTGNTILITGGNAGIGLAFAKTLCQSGK